MKRGFSVLGALLAYACIACSSSGDEANDTGGGGSGNCPDGQVRFEGNCVDSVGRYEPEERVDFDNVVNYGPEPTLDLPEPPKSGFRLVVSPRTIEPGGEIQDCHAWQYPQIAHKNVYAARLYTSGGLHHSNMFGVPLADIGPSPYPACNPGQADIIGQVTNWIAGELTDVLFANSTQVLGGEAVVFPPGMAFALHTEGREVATTIHWYNTTSEIFTSEVVYDFYTMPDDQVQTEIVPFVFENREFSIPAKETGDIVSTCDIMTPPGNIVSIMPHTHSRAIAFAVDLLDTNGAETRIYEGGSFDVESDIEVFDEPVSLDGFTSIRHRCTVANDLDQPIVWGVGDNEMCTLFGYLYRPEAQQIGYTAPGATACLALNVGQFR